MPRQWNRSTICRCRSAALWCWPPTRGTKVVGIVASRLSEKYACPSFMIHLSGTVGKGSCRSWGGFNLFAALERCSDLLLDFGGHELAAGFTIDVANIPAFRQRMNSWCGNIRAAERRRYVWRSMPPSPVPAVSP